MNKDYIQGATSSGFKYKIENKRLNNYILLETISKLEEDPLAITKVLELLLGSKQKEKLIDHLKDDEGIVDMDKMEREIEDIFKAEEIKN
ncbi:MAG: hypothetical protein SPI59_01360 [Finegoldia sp.]|nr:hypothetical protein [Bacteroidaceae bacterium]MDY6064957.1 hypothetical protein [Finegoldia sp.]